MPSLWKAFSLSSSSQHSSSSTTTTASTTSSPADSPNTRRIYGGGRKLTRQRKLRHVSDDDLGLRRPNIQALIIDERSKSLPGSPDSYADFGSGSRSSHHHLRHCSNSSAVPLPLPLPELNSLPKQNSVDSNLPARVDRELLSPPLARETFDRTPAEVKSSQHPRSSTPTYRRRGFPQDLNAEGVEFRLNVPARSAPSSGFTSPVRSPKRFSTQDLFHHPLHQASSSPSEAYSFQLSPTRVINSADHSPLSSPILPSSANRIRNSRSGAVHSHHKSLPESSLGWNEANNNNVHPLPLPPGVPRQPESCTMHSNMDKPCVSPAKGQWLKGKLLGRGTFGSVYEATNCETGALCAMKEVHLTPDDPKSAECIKQLEQEIRVLQQLKHQNIVQYYGSEIMEDRFCIYLEYVHPGSINKYVREHCGAMTESIVRNFTRHIVSGLAYLHSTKTIHRDIKGANLLVDASGVVKLADFGLAKHVMQAVLRKDANPELALAVDIWSLGCTVIEMFTGQPPWGELSWVQAMFGVLNKSPPIPEKLSPEGKDFLQCCFRRKPADRPSAMKLLEHAFLRSTSFLEHSINVAGCSEDSPGKKFHDTLSPKNPINHKKEQNPLLPGTSGRHAKSPCSSLCAGAEFLFQVVQEAIPQAYDETDSPISATAIAVHILNYLYKKLTEVCLVQGGEEDAYRMILHAFVSTLFPYIEGLDSWLYEGILDDPFEEMFFHANKRIAVEESEFWEKSYLLRSAKLDTGRVTDSLLSIKRTNDVSRKEPNDVSGLAKEKGANGRDLDVCPLFMKEIARDIISAGKSLQLVQHTRMTSSVSASGRIAGLSLSEIFCVTLSALIGYGDHISEYFLKEKKIVPLVKSFTGRQKVERNNESFQEMTCSDKEWCKFLVDTMAQKGKANHISCHALGEEVDSFVVEGDKLALDGNDILSLGFRPENPAITTSQNFLHANRDAWGPLNLSREFFLPPLNDEGLRQAIFNGSAGSFVATKSTNYTFGFQFGESERDRLKEDVTFLEELFPFPTLLPPFREDDHVSEVFPFQENSTLPSRTLNWIGRVEPRNTPLPMVILQECLIVFIKKQADCIGRNILSKLLSEWRLLEELEVLRAIYLLGSGDLLQHFLTVVFNKLDKGESLDDDFELNTTLQESIRYSADAALLSTPDSLVVSVTRNNATIEDDQRGIPLPTSTPRKSRGQNFGIDGLDSLMFTYKVPWPLELIANTEAIKKYNQVMRFLLKVRRAKFVLDKARRWMWKDRSSASINRKHHWLLEQKLLHFVDAFHHYVMDRVYHSAWGELCEGLAAARSLDEVIEIHEAYLMSIQRQCFAVPEKLWALIASRINSILGLALDFYSVQQTLSSGGAVSAIKARCEMEINRIEKQFDDCIAFLVRILSFKLNVGQFPHLADLVTRINYNHFYMSHNGSLINAPGSNAVPGKLFAGQRD